jgi:hypothetical protein
MTNEKQKKKNQHYFNYCVSQTLPHCEKQFNAGKTYFGSHGQLTSLFLGLQ